MYLLLYEIWFTFGSSVAKVIGLECYKEDILSILLLGSDSRSSNSILHTGRFLIVNYKSYNFYFNI